MGVPLLTRIPLDPQVALASESGTPVSAPHYSQLADFVRKAAQDSA